jgi:hypothetical protein
LAVVYRHIRLDNGQPFYIGAKQKLRDFWKGKPKAPFSEEHKRKLSEARIGNTNRKKKINEIGKL